MPHRRLVLALGLIAAAAPLPAASRMAPMPGTTPATMPAPAGTADTLYCMRIEAATGSRIEPVRCWTREEWILQGVDVDRDWAEEGVRTVG